VFSFPAKFSQRFLGDTRLYHWRTSRALVFATPRSWVEKQNVNKNVNVYLEKHLPNALM